MNYDHVLPVEKLKRNSRIGLGLFILWLPVFIWFKKTDDIYIFILAWVMFFSSAVLGGLNGLALLYRTKNLPIPETKHDISDSFYKIVYEFSCLAILVLGLFIPVVFKAYL